MKNNQSITTQDITKTFCKAVKKLMENGLNEQEAKNKAKEILNKAVDIICKSNQSIQQIEKHIEFLFTMDCKEFGPKFKFTAKDQHDADLKAKEYCNYHSHPNQYKAVPFDLDKDYGFIPATHNEWVI